MSQRDVRKENYELMLCEHFVRLLNFRFRTDYRAVSPRRVAVPGIMPDIDAVGISTSEQYPPLYIQHTDDLQRDLSESGKIFTRVHKMPIFTCGTLNILEAVRKKQKKYEVRGKNMMDVTLLVSGSQNPDYLLEDINFSEEEIQQMDFKNICYISKPAILDGGKQRGWYVSLLKWQQSLDRGAQVAFLELVSEGSLR